MPHSVTADYVRATLAAQGCEIDQAAARAIADNLAAQWLATSPAYDRLAFETEPSGFLRTLSEAGL